MDPSTPPPPPPDFPTTVPPQAKKSSTLKIVLMIVIPIVVLLIVGGIVAGFLVVPKVLEEARKAQAGANANNLVVSIALYGADYGILPRMESDGNGNIPSDHRLINILTGVDVESNPRETAYLSGRKALDPDGDRPARGGMVSEGSPEGSASLVDDWGNYYMIRIDSDDDGKIELPNQLGVVKAKAVCWSYGPPSDKGDHRSALDNDPGQWITSWTDVDVISP